MQEYYATGESYDVMGDRWAEMPTRNLTTGRRDHAVIPVPAVIFPGC